MKYKVLLLALLTIPAAAMAQTTIELTPSVGYRWGGELLADDNDLFTFDVDVESSDTLGLQVGIPLNRFFELEFMADRQETSFGPHRLFGEDTIDTRVDITYYHAGLLFQWQAGQTRPYVVGSLGVAEIDPDIRGVTSENVFSGSLGGGVKVDINEHFGVRFEIRGLWANTDRDDWWDDDDHWWDDDCDDHWDDCWDDWDNRHGGNDLFQAQGKVGVIFKF